MWGFWQNGHRAPGRKQALLEPLLASLTDGETVRDRIKVLSDAPREVLLRLVRREGYAGGVADLLAMKNGKALETYEVEAGANALRTRGFLDIVRSDASKRGGSKSGRSGGSRGRNGGATKRRGVEQYCLPRDLGALIAGMLEEEHRGPREVFSLSGHLGTLTPGELRTVLRHAEEPPELGAPPEELAAALLHGLPSDDGDPASRLDDEALADAVRRAVLLHGGIVEGGVFAAEYGAYERATVQDALEDAAVGTVTTLELSGYGIEMPGETVVVFAEVAERLLDRSRASEPPHDAVAAAGVDLLTDLQEFLKLAASTPLRVTQGRTIYRAAQHRIRDTFIFLEHEWMTREDVFDLLYSLAFRLELIEVTDESRLRLTAAGKAWDSTDLNEKVETLYGRLLDERLPEGRDFHVRRLRRAVAHMLALAPRARFLLLDDVPFRIRNDHFAALEDEGVDEQYRNRFQYTYTPPVETGDQVTQELRDYLLRRLHPLGIVDVATLGGTPVGVRLTDIGRRLLGVDDGDESDVPVFGPPLEVDVAKPLVVNPDFEVIHFPEGDVPVVAHTLGRFAVRTKSEHVAHYRIARETVERAVVKGFGAEEILAFLSANARTPVPQNVAYSIREWASRVRIAEQREGVILTTGDAAAMDAVLTVEAVRRLLVDRPAPSVAILRSRITDFKVLDYLRRAGVYFR